AETVWLHWPEFPCASDARQVRVVRKPWAQLRLVTVFRITTKTLVPSTASIAVGRSKSQAVPHRIVLLPAQVKAGGAVSTMLTVCEHEAWLPQSSTAFHVRVTLNT